MKAKIIKFLKVFNNVIWGAIVALHWYERLFGKK